MPDVIEREDDQSQRRGDLDTDMGIHPFPPIPPDPDAEDRRPIIEDRQPMQDRGNKGGEQSSQDPGHWGEPDDDNDDLSRPQTWDAENQADRAEKSWEGE